jgi:hypothetical protein
MGENALSQGGRILVIGMHESESTGHRTRDSWRAMRRHRTFPSLAVANDEITGWHDACRAHAMLRTAPISDSALVQDRLIDIVNRKATRPQRNLDLGAANSHRSPTASSDRTSDRTEGGECSGYHTIKRSQSRENKRSDTDSDDEVAGFGRLSPMSRSNETRL